MINSPESPSSVSYPTSSLEPSGTPEAGPTAPLGSSAEPVDPSSPPIFPLSDPPQTHLCSYNECLSGHQSPAAMQTARCPGCSGWMLAVQKAQCPYCNEPIVRTMLRSDYIPRGAGVAKRCQGQAPQGESLDIELSRTSWSEAEANYKPFLAREAEERKEKV